MSLTELGLDILADGVVVLGRNVDEMGRGVCRWSMRSSAV